MTRTRGRTATHPHGRGAQSAGPGASMRRLISIACLFSALACDCDSAPTEPTDGAIDGGLDLDAATDAASEAGPVEVPCELRPCAEAVRDEAGDCTYHAARESEPCDDGDACTAEDTCRAGACGGTAI